MKREEAIERLKQNKAAAEFYVEIAQNIKSIENELKDIEAFDMAIEALQALQVEPTHGRLIDVDELLKKYTTCADIDCDTCPIWECGCDGLLQILKEASIIKDANGGEDE